MIDDDIMQQISKGVWVFRGMVKDKWPTPDPKDAIRFAYTEAAEVMDAWLRLNRTQYSRNHNKNIDLIGEVADTLIMLLTANPTVGTNRYTFDDVDADPTIDGIVSAVGKAFTATIYNRGDALLLISDAAWNCYQFLLEEHYQNEHGEPIEIIKGRLNAIYNKHYLNKP